MSAPPITERHLPHFHRRAPVLEAVRVATTANITISTALNNGDSLDGVTLATGDRVLVKDQSTASENGIYEVGASPARAYDLSTDDPNFGFLVYVKAGTANAGTLWHNANTSSPTVGSSSITFAQVTADTTDLTAAVFGYQAHGNLGSTETFDSAVAGWHSGTLNADCTFTFTAPASGTVGSMVLELTQDGTGGWAITFPGSVVGDFTGYDTTAGTTSLLMFFTRDGGTTWFGFIAGGSGSASPLTTKGDLWGFDTADTRVPVGSNGTFLRASSGATPGVAWQTAALDDLSDVTITSAAAADRLRYNGSVWVNSALRWSPTTTFDGTNWLLVTDGSGNPVLTEV